MKTMKIITAAAVLVFSGSVVMSKPLDVITARCLQVDTDKTAAYVLMWLAGASSDLFRTSVYVSSTETNARKLAAYCSRHPRIPLHEALDDLGILDD